MLVYHNDVIINGIIKESFYEELINTTKSEKELEEFHKNKALTYLTNLEN